MKNSFITCFLLVIMSHAWGQKVIRGPYLQMAGPSSMTIRFRTDSPVNAEVGIGTDAKTFTRTKKTGPASTEHTILIDSLAASRTYYYRVKTGTNTLGDSTYFFKTAPAVGSSEKFRFWSLGDMFPGAVQERVYEAFLKYNGANYTNFLMTVGDNTYNGGSDGGFQSNFFDVYQKGTFMRQSALFMGIGNHDYGGYPHVQDLPDMGYYQIFNLPAKGELGGIPSGSEAYYSFNYGSTHFISLDSFARGRDGKLLTDPGSEQLEWLIKDLQNTKQRWKIVYFHHPPYTKGTYDSDVWANLTQPRLVVTPILEKYGVDVVLNGHSHVYERSKPIKGFTGVASEFNPAVHFTQTSSGKYNASANSCPYLFTTNQASNGVIYVVNGVGGATGAMRANAPHPVMETSQAGIGGSMIFDIEGGRLDAKFLTENGTITDQFTIFKDLNVTDPAAVTVNYQGLVSLTAPWQGEYIWNTGEKTRVIQKNPIETQKFTVKDPQNCFQTNYQVNVMPPLGINELPDDVFENLKIYDFNGRLLREIQTPGKLSQVNLTDLPAGRYILQLQINGHDQIIKLAR
jgi:3',5'-cyclic AMP phosphodiesterase CpdA